MDTCYKQHTQTTREYSSIITIRCHYVRVRACTCVYVRVRRTTRALSTDTFEYNTLTCIGVESTVYYRAGQSIILRT